MLPERESSASSQLSDRPSDSESAPNRLKGLDFGLESHAAPAYWQSARALAVHCPKPLATMLRMTEQT